MKSIYSYNSLKDNYIDFLCLVDKMKLFDVLDSIIEKINLDFDVEEREDSISIVFTNGKMIKVYEEFIFEINKSVTLDIDDNNLVNTIVEMINVQSLNTQDIENKKIIKTEENNNVNVSNNIEIKETTSQVDNIIIKLCDEFDVRNYLHEDSFLSIVNHDTEGLAIGELSKQKRLSMLFYLAYINQNAGMELELKFTSTYVGLKDEIEAKYYCLIVFAREVLRVDGEDKLNLNNITKYKIDQCFGFNGVTKKTMVINKPTSVNSKRSYSSATNNSYKSRYQKYKCPYCGADLELKSGKYGMFYGCSRWPRCDYTRDV